MQKTIITQNGDAIASTQATYIPDEGGLIIEYSKKINIEGQDYSQGVKRIVVPKSPTTDLIVEYILSFIE